jgi:hypothetical protein
LYVSGIDNVVWDSQRLNLAHKRKYMVAASSKFGERCVQILAGKPIGKKLLGIPRGRWEENIKLFLQGEDWGRGLKLYALGQEYVVC